jgi:hypothetical protein
VQLLRDLAQLRIFTDDARRAATCGHFFLEKQVLGEHAPLGDRTFDKQEEMIRLDRLREEVERALLHGRHGVLNAAVSGHHDHRKLGVELLGRTQHAEPVAGRQLEIAQDNRGAGRAKGADGLGFIARLNDHVALRLERMAQHRPQRVLVFD